MALLEIAVIPKGCHEAGISKYLVEPLKILEDSGLTFEVHEMGTVVEGTASQLFKIAQAMHDASFNGHVERVLTTLTIDERRDKPVQIRERADAFLLQHMNAL